MSGAAATEAQAFDFCLHLTLAHAALMLKLDEELGTLHGLGFSDFMLLYCLSRAEDGQLRTAELVKPLGIQRSAVIRKLIPLEKTGHVQRMVDPSSAGHTVVRIRPAGRRIVTEALQTAGWVCSDATRGLQPEALVAAQAALGVVSASTGRSLCGTTQSPPSIAAKMAF